MGGDFVLACTALQHEHVYLIWRKFNVYHLLMQNINPTLLLATFLPVLLFNSAFQAHWHTVRRQKIPILLLVS